MGLVDYGSDSGSDSDHAPTPAPIASTSTSSKLTLPAPTASASTTTTKLPSKKVKGPVRILLDLPPPSNSSIGVKSNESGQNNEEDDEEGPAKKKVKLTLGGGGGGLSGLMSLLPPPKNAGNGVMIEKVLGASGSARSSATVMAEVVPQFIPYSVGKGKKVVGPSSTSIAVEPVVDFFNLGTSSVAATKVTTTSTTKKMSISSAPEIYSSSFGATPTALDPYPGFIQNDQGIWEAKDQATYELYLASTTTTAVDAALEESTAAKGKGAEKGFDAKSLKDIVEIDANSGRKAWEAREREVVPKLVAPQGGQLGKSVQKGKGRHQLSSLLSAAVENRAELEERIAQGKANRKQAGNKYGF